MTLLLTRTDLAVVRTGLANTASVLAAVERAGARPRLVDDPAEVRRATYVVLPGVGSFGAATQTLKAGLRNALRQRVELDAPTLGICLGMQLFGTASEEAPGARGLGIVPTRITRMEAADRLPVMGWSPVEPDASCSLVQPGWAYFAHTYAMPQAPGPWGIARAGHGRAIAALEHGNVLACQFHPELSGAYGADLLQRWMKRGAQA